MLRESGTSQSGPQSLHCANDHAHSVRRFAEDVVGPKVREMDENEMMDPSIVKALFEQGVCTTVSYLQDCH